MEEGAGGTVEEDGLSAARPFPPAERGAWRLLLIGAGLLLVPMAAYPGNWADVAPTSAATEAAWAMLGTIVFVALAIGMAVGFVGWRRLMRAWSTRAPGTARRSVAEAIRGRRGRWAFVLSAVAYLIFVSTFLSLYGWSAGGPGIWNGTYPAAANVLCCGPLGDTPVAILIVSPTFELVAIPVVLATVYASTLLFAMNVAVATSLLRRRSVGIGVGGASVGAASAVLVTCPSCGTILLANVLVGTAGAGVLAAWAAYSIPLMLVSFPLSALALLWTGRRLSRIALGDACRVRPAPS